MQRKCIQCMYCIISKFRFTVQKHRFVNNFNFKHLHFHVLSGALKSRDLTSRDWITRHQIKQIATGWTSVGLRKNRKCWTISELNPVCHDSTAALIVACSSCVQSDILSALIRSPYSRGSTTAATQQQQQRERRREQASARASSDNFRGVGIGNGSSCINLWGCDDCHEVCPSASWRHVLASHWCHENMRGSVKFDDKTWRSNQLLAQRLSGLTS